MPKKVYKPFNGKRSSNGRSDGKHYFDHDDRDVRMDDASLHHSGGNRPRVSFKNQTNYRLKIQKRDILIPAIEDIVTTFPHSSLDNNNSRQVIYRGRGRGLSQGGRRSPISQRGSKLPGRPNRPGSSLLNEFSWYKVIIPFGNKYSKDFIITNLTSFIAPETFTPVMYKVMGQEAIFYVDDHKIANKLLQCDRRITTADGYKIGVKVRAGFPQCEVDSVLKQKLKDAMAKRYVHETNALDLSRFHHDPELVDDYFCALFRPTMLMEVLNIIAEAIPNLEALNLDNNKLHIIERLNVLAKKFPNLKTLYIGDNKIREINQIDVIKELKLEELKLAGNPVCSKYRTRNDDYVSDVRKRFPKLLRLDGAELPKPILFDVEDEGIKLPPSQQIFSINDQAKEIANQFMQTYFTIFDSDSRQPLLDAYHEQACFSLTISSLHKFNQYLSNNRNLFRINDPARRRKLLKQGRLPVVSYFSEIPKTKHYLDSFTMDINLVTETMMLITITGCFKELDTKDQLNRYFDRIFTIVPEGTGFCITNEQLFLTYPTPEQEKQLRNPTITSIPQAGPSTASTTMVSPVSNTIVDPSDEIKQQMVISLSQQTNMNVEWSLKCLQEVQWAFDTALLAFNDFFKRGQIPPEAFKK